MAIVRDQCTDNFTVVDDATLSDERLSWGARGLLAYLLSKPDDWSVQPKQLVKAGKSGRDAVYRMLSELESCGYARKRQNRNGGKFGGNEWIIYSAPQNDSPRPENPDTAPCTGKPYTENPDAVKQKQTTQEQRVIPRPENPDTAPCTGKPYTENPDTYLVLSNTHPPTRARSGAHAREETDATNRVVQDDDSTNGDLHKALPQTPNTVQGYPPHTEIQDTVPTGPDSELAFGDVVQALQTCGTPFHFCTGQRDRDVIRGWQGAGTTHADLQTAITRAVQNNKGGAIGPRYLDSFVRQVVTERLALMGEGTEPDDTRPLEDASTGDKTASRGKKKRPKKNNALLRPDNMPTEIDESLWQDFMDHRKAIKKPMTQQAVNRMANKLENMKADGHDPARSLEESIINGWSGAFPPKNDDRRNNGGHHGQKYQGHHGSRASEHTAHMLAIIEAEEGQAFQINDW